MRKIRIENVLILFLLKMLVSPKKTFRLFFHSKIVNFNCFHRFLQTKLRHQKNTKILNNSAIKQDIKNLQMVLFLFQTSLLIEGIKISVHCSFKGLMQRKNWYRFYDIFWFPLRHWPRNCKENRNRSNKTLCTSFQSCDFGHQNCELFCPFVTS